MRPSFIANGVSGTLLSIAIVLIIYVVYYKKINIDTLTTIQLLIGLSIAVGVHGLAHMFEEYYYDFNPFVGKWKPRDEPVKRN